MNNTSKITHWTWDVTWTACGQKIAIPYVAYRMTPDGQRPGPIMLQQMFKPKYVNEAAKRNEVNCPTCIAAMKTTSHHCVFHGFIAGREVTSDEKCAISTGHTICGHPC